MTAKLFVDFVLRHTLPSRARANGPEVTHDLIKNHPFVTEAPASRLIDTLNAASAKVAENSERAAEIRANWTDGLEAPAEGAGEALLQQWIDAFEGLGSGSGPLINSTRDYLARARSSAPEAREGGAVRRQRCTQCDRGEVFGMSDDSGFWVEFSSVAGGGNEHGMNGWLELVEHWPDGRDVRREYVAKDSPLYAAPSADKLREVRQDVINQMADNIEKLALTPAKRELVKAAFRACIGRLSTPDALKGDGK